MTYAQLKAWIAGYHAAQAAANADAWDGKLRLVSEPKTAA